MINVGDVGEDYEHGVQLLKKLNEFRGAGTGVSNGNTCDRKSQDDIQCLLESFDACKANDYKTSVKILIYLWSDYISHSDRGFGCTVS